MSAADRRIGWLAAAFLPIPPRESQKKAGPKAGRVLTK
jgi:hypothetical protein